MKYDIMDSRCSPVHVAYMRVGWEITNVRFPGPAWTRTSVTAWCTFEVIFRQVFYFLDITDVFKLETFFHKLLSTLHLKLYALLTVL